MSADQPLLKFGRPSPSSCGMLGELIAGARIALRRGTIFDRKPAALNLSELRAHQRVEGMLIGLAVGDALGHATEWQYDPDRRHREFGTIVDHAGPSKPGRISDDTQLSFWTLEALLNRGRFDFDELVSLFVERRNQIVGIGQNTAGALARHETRLGDGTPPAHECPGDFRTEGRGNGAVMRFAPLLLPHLREPSPELWSDLALAAFITHGNPAALAAVVAFGHLLWELLRRPTGDAPPPEWWLDEYVRVAQELEPWPQSFALTSNTTPAYLRDYEGYLWQFLDTQVRQAWRRDISVRDACSMSGFGSGADCVQSVPAVLYILMHHADSFESAIIAAVNDSKDNDTVASIVGAFLGALHGERSIRQRWIEGISSASLRASPNSTTDDRAAIHELATRAVAQFV